MARQIDKIKYQRYKSNRLQGLSKCQSLKNAGYKDTTATRCQNTLNLVKLGEAEIRQELKESDITPQFIIKRLNEDRQAAIESGDIANRVKVDELLGKYIAMFTERREINAVVLSHDDLNILQRYVIDVKHTHTIDNTKQNALPPTEKGNSGIEGGGVGKESQPPTLL